MKTEIFLCFMAVGLILLCGGLIAFEAGREAPRAWVLLMNGACIPVNVWTFITNLNAIRDR